MPNQWLRISACVFFLSLTACGSLTRHPDSGYGPESREIPLAMTSGEAYTLAPYQRDPASLSSAERVYLNEKLALQQREKAISDLEVRRLYERHKNRLQSNGEKIYFLDLPTYAAKVTYLKAKNLYIDDTQYTEQMEDLIAANDISIGMPMKAVEESWGPPRLREVSGHRILGNERWHFTKYVKSVEGYKREDRVVIFEGGVVKGWETH